MRQIEKEDTMQNPSMKIGDTMKEDGYVYSFTDCAKNTPSQTELTSSEEMSPCKGDCIKCHLSLWETVGSY
jgi:hypothetical protein